MDALEVIRKRRSIRSYQKEKISRELLESLVEAGRLAATARNEQPWEFIVVTEAEMLRRLAEATTYGKHIAEAPAAIVVYCRHTKYEVEDGSAATQNILLAACAQGLGTCWVNGSQATYAGKVSELLGVPADYRLVSLIPVGRPAADPKPPKRPLKEVLHWEKF
jgi:nitroreductase